MRMPATEHGHARTRARPPSFAPRDWDTPPRDRRRRPASAIGWATRGSAKSMFGTDVPPAVDVGRPAPADCARRTAIVASGGVRWTYSW